MGHNSSLPKLEDPVVLEPSGTHTATVIFLHGLGDTGVGWSQTFARIRHPHIKYVFPTANAIPVTLNGGIKMPCWFDIKGLDPSSPQDESGIRSASQLLQSLVAQEEKNGIPRQRIVVGGFSQGGAIALYSSFVSAHQPFAGIVALSTWLPMHYHFPGALKGNQQTPILQCHGLADVVVMPSFGILTGQLIKSFNSHHELKTYQEMGHSSCKEELQDVKNFIERYLPVV